MFSNSHFPVTFYKTKKLNSLNFLSLTDAFFLCHPTENVNHPSSHLHFKDQLNLVSKYIPPETRQAGKIVVEHFNVGNSILLLCNKSMIDGVDE